jgi:hypothetical protein
MRIQRILKAHIRKATEGVSVAGDVNAVVAANVSEPEGSVVASAAPGDTDNQEEEEVDSSDR